MEDFLAYTVLGLSTAAIFAYERRPSVCSCSMIALETASSPLPLRSITAELTDTDPVLWHRTLATVGIDATARTIDVHENGPCGHRMAPVEETV